MSRREFLLPCPFCGRGHGHLYSFRLVGTFRDLWRVTCTTCMHTSSDYESEEKAIDWWNSLPRPLKWTNELPKIPGMYWNRSSRHPKDMYVIRVSEDKIELYETLYCPSDEQWAGPIPEPHEEEMDA